METKVLLESAADLLDKLAGAIGEQLEQGIALEEKLASANQLTKQAADHKAAVAGLAKTAASAAFDAAIVRDERTRDDLAVRLLDHGQALEELAKVASLIDAPSVGHVVRVGQAKVASADDVWSAAVRDVNASF